MPFFKTTKGINLHYRIAGKGKPIIFIHGWAMNSLVWKYQLDELSRDFQVIAVDLRGHGKSLNQPIPPLKKGGEGGFDSFVQDLKELTDALTLGKFVLAGWSMASFIIARYYFKYPEDVYKLIFISGTPKFAKEKGYPYGQHLSMVRRLEQNLKRDYKNHIREFCNKFFLSGEKIDYPIKDFGDSDNRLNDIKNLMFNEDFPPPPDVALKTMDSLLVDDIRDTLKYIRVPTLIVHGSIDKICPVGAARYMTREIPHSKKIVIEGTGHAPFLTQPKRVNKEIRDFCHNSATN